MPVPSTADSAPPALRRRRPLGACCRPGLASPATPLPLPDSRCVVFIPVRSTSHISFLFQADSVGRVCPLAVLPLLRCTLLQPLCHLCYIPLRHLCDWEKRLVRLRHRPSFRVRRSTQGRTSNRPSTAPGFPGVGGSFSIPGYRASADDEPLCVGRQPCSGFGRG